MFVQELRIKGPERSPDGGSASYKYENRKTKIG